jgi:inositol transport system ATP-binding protein
MMEPQRPTAFASPAAPPIAPGSDVVLEVDSVAKRFPGVQALDGVTLRVRRGSVHALVGENGAGKSTLVKILVGIHRRDSGRVTLMGNEVDFIEPRQALRAGVSIIEQELSPVGEMTIAENIFLGREPRTAGVFVDFPRLHAQTRALLDQLEMRLDPRRKMRTLTVAEMQLVEIAKAISYDADLVIMDEPTSALGDHEVDHLMTIIRRLKARGAAVIYISHKLEEVFEITDEVTVLRDGKLVGSYPTAEVDRDSLIRLMIGREVKGFPKTNVPTSKPLLGVRGLVRPRELYDIDFTLHEGEILGVFGLLGAGKSELLNTLFGVTRPHAGEVTFAGRSLLPHQPSQAIAAGMALLTEDRKGTGLFLPMSVTDNMAMSTLDRFTSAGFVSGAKVRRAVQQTSKDLDVRMASAHQLVKYLSGGNQQKVLLGRWLLTEPRLLLLDEPTRGIDVGAKREIYRFMSEFVGHGKGILLASSELPEVLGMSDRILVMRNGHLAGIVDAADATEESVMQLAV